MTLLLSKMLLDVNPDAPGEQIRSIGLGNLVKKNPRHPDRGQVAGSIMDTRHGKTSTQKHNRGPLRPPRLPALTSERAGQAVADPDLRPDVDVVKAVLQKPITRRSDF